MQVLYASSVGSTICSSDEQCGVRLSRDGPHWLKDCGGWLVPAATVVIRQLRGVRYGGRAERGTKKGLYQGILADTGFVRIRSRNRTRKASSWCYLGL